MYFRRSHSWKISRSSTNEDVLNLFAVPKEQEDLSSSDATATEGGSNDTSEEIAN